MAIDIQPLMFLLTFVVGLQANDVRDFRHISFKDMLPGAHRLEIPGVQSYTRLLFDLDRDQIVIGARDHLIRASVSDLSVLELLEWSPSGEIVQTCLNKGQSELSCRNHVMVLLKSAPTAGYSTELGNSKELIYTCGTHAYSPICCWRKIDDLNTTLECHRGIGVCPYNPLANTTALLTSQVGTSGRLYAGATMDFSGQDSAIYRTNPYTRLGKHAIKTGTPSPGSQNLRTHQYDSKWLNDPQFVGSFQDEEYVYFLFREAAVEYINCGKRIYSRIARVCKNDSGGQLVLKDNWTSFVKARLNCSQAGDYPFYYDEIQAIAYDEEEQVLYATFQTPGNSIAGSAICSFNMSSIRTAFAGPFKHQQTPTSTWESKNAAHASCSQPRGALESSRYQLMDRSVQPTSITPLHTVQLERYTHIALDSIDTSLYQKVRILYVATEEGLVKKISVLSRTGTACIVEVWSVEQNSQVKITALHYVKSVSALYISTDLSVLRTPVHHCSRHLTQQACIDAMDPHCGWDSITSRCVVAPMGNPLSQHWKQSVTQCAHPDADRDGGWGAWGTWETCLQGDSSSDTCLCQSRSCDNPVPFGSGAKCSGASVRVTNCTTHGGWTQWSAWSACSQTCGIAVKTRRRSCSNPVASHGGRVCVGVDINEIYCTGNPPCPAVTTQTEEEKQQNKSTWSIWSGWSSCSSHCGGGYRVRKRVCSSTSVTDSAATGSGESRVIQSSNCLGSDMEYQMCNEHSCAEHKKLSSWTQWIPVRNSTNVDGIPEEQRFRYLCRAPVHSSLIRLSSREEKRVCDQEQGCVMDQGLLRNKFSEDIGFSSRQDCVGLEEALTVRGDRAVTGAVGVTIVILSTFGAFLLGATCAAAIVLYRARRGARVRRVPGSPCYVTGGSNIATSKQNAYVSVPLREISVKRQSSFSGGKSNNMSTSNNTTPKLYPKSIAVELRGHNNTMKRTNDNINNTTRNDYEQDKFY